MARASNMTTHSTRRKALIAAGAVVAGGLALCVGPACADDMPVFAIEFKDGTIAPLRLEVPAGRPFKIELHNTGNSPAEFESTELHLEKVLAAQSSSFLVIRKLEAGEHKFFDDFHPDAPQALLVAK
jgi:hypothetical protein